MRYVGVLDDIKSRQPQKNFVIKTKKTFHKGYLFGHVSNGGGVVDLGDGYALKFTATDKFVTVELLDFGKYSKVETQTWNKTKKVDKGPKIVIKKADKDGKTTLFDLH